MRSRSLPALVVFAMTSLAVARAQEPPAAPPPTIKLRVLGADGQPLPGVPLFVESRPRQPAIAPDGLLIAESDDVRRLRAAKFLTTDPNGEVTLASRQDIGSLSVAEPFFATTAVTVARSEVSLRVGKREPVGVRVFDSEGAPMPSFPVALHADGRDLAIALTDRQGRAVLGIPEGFEARAVVAPAGWVGPKDAFPSIADTLPGSRRVTLTMPPHGSLILRAVRAGHPTQAPLTASSFHRPTDYFPLSAHAGVNAPAAAGVRYPLVALGVALGCYSPLRSHSGGLLECQGPTKAGETKVVDVELGPLFRFRLDIGANEADLALARVHVVTDETEFVGYATHEAEDRWTLDPQHAVLGTKLRRFSVDGNVGLTDKVPFSGTIPCEHALASASIDLGTVSLAKVGPQLRGVVLDTAGKPVEGAQVHVSRVPQPNTGNLFVTDVEGRFVTTALPIARDDAGVPIELFAKARHRGAATEFVQGVAGEVTLVLTDAVVEKTPRLVQNGRVVARLRNLAKDKLTRFDVRLVSHRGEFLPTRLETDPDGVTVVWFENLREGAYSLHVPGPSQYAVAVVSGLAVPADGECADSRLADVHCDRAWRRVSLRVVDGEGIAIAGARLTASRVSLRSDGKGDISLWIGRDPNFRAVVSAPGWRSVVVSDWPDAQQIRLEPPGALVVAVRGLPADVPRERIEVWLRDHEHGALGGPRANLVADGSDSVTLELPARGRYLPTLWVKLEDSTGRSGSARGLHLADTAVSVDGPPSEPIEITLSATEIERLRELLAK